MKNQDADQEPLIVRAYKERLRKEGNCQHNAEPILKELLEGLRRVEQIELEGLFFEALKCVAQEARQSLVPLTIWLEESEWGNELWSLDDLINSGLIGQDELVRYSVPGVIHKSNVSRKRKEGVGWFLQGLMEAYCAHLLDAGNGHGWEQVRRYLVPCEHK
jgi:hypothetical protein